MRPNYNRGVLLRRTTEGAYSHWRGGFQSALHFMMT